MASRYEQLEYLASDWETLNAEIRSDFSNPQSKTLKSNPTISLHNPLTPHYKVSFFSDLFLLI